MTEPWIPQIDVVAAAREEAEKVMRIQASTRHAAIVVFEPSHVRLAELTIAALDALRPDPIKPSVKVVDGLRGGKAVYVNCEEPGEIIDGSVSA